MALQNTFHCHISMIHINLNYRVVHQVVHYLFLTSKLSQYRILILRCNFQFGLQPDGPPCILPLSLSQSVVRFLWDAHNCEDSPADAEVQLGVSFAYVERWNDLEQLWFLGMQILNSLMKPVSEVDILINSSQICKLSYVKHEFNSSFLE